MSADVIAKVREALEKCVDHIDRQYGAPPNRLAHDLLVEARAALALLDRVEREPVAWRIDFRGITTAGERGPWQFSHYTNDGDEATRWAGRESEFSERRAVPLYALAPTEENDG